jgi:serine/alanine adding enzyme
MDAMFGLEVVEASKDDEWERWDRYVLEHPMASGYHLTAWRLVMEAAFGHRTFYLIVRDGHREVRGVLPLVFLSSRLFGRFLVSLPFLNYGGLLVDTVEAREALLRAAVDLAGELRAAYIELRQQEMLTLEWPVKQHKVSMHLELPRDFEILWKAFPAKLRSQIRRAQKAGMTVRIGREEMLDDFYRVFSRNMRDLGTPVYGRKVFETILRTFPKDARLCVAYLAGWPTAVGFLYSFREMLQIPWASSDRRYNYLAPNMLLYSSALEYACQEGFRVFDFGRSTPGSGTYRFKEQWGAQPVPLHWYYWLSDGGPLPELTPQNPEYSLAISAWKRVPVTLTRIIGPAIARNIP